MAGTISGFGLAQHSISYANFSLVIPGDDALQFYWRWPRIVFSALARVCFIGFGPAAVGLEVVRGRMQIINGMAGAGNI